MSTYMFERTNGNLSVAQVKSIIKKAGEETDQPDNYMADDYKYSQEDTHSVHAVGPDSMNPGKLSHAATNLGIKRVTVSFLDSDLVLTDTPNIYSNGLSKVARTADNPLGATNYGVTITMSQETVKLLSAGNYSLFAFKAVQTTVGGGAPLVWFKSQDFGLETSVDWQVQYEAYTSRSAIVPNGKITGLNSYPADLGQRLEVTTRQGTGSVKSGSAGNISIENMTDTPMTCGISEIVSGSAEPLCAFPLYGNQLDAIVPIQKVMFTFSTKTVDTGTVIEKAYSQSILIDLTASSTRKVTFDMNKGWSWGGGSWAQAIRPSTNVVPLLIESGSGNAITMLD